MKLSPLPSGWTVIIIICLGIAVVSGPANAQRPLGCDVSVYQGASINWTSVKNYGIAFAWARANDGTGITDSTYAGNASRGKSAGVYIGGYDFAQPNLNSPATEAAYFWAITGGNTKADGLSLMPMLDFEVFSGAVGASSYGDWANQWCQTIVNDVAASGAFAKPAIYISACHAQLLNSSVSQWYNDIADYNGESAQTGTPWSVCSGDNVWGGTTWNFWQYNDTASISGFPAEQPDVDVFNGSAATLASTYLISSLNYAIYTWDPQGTAGANPYTGSMNGTWENSSWSTTQAGQASPTGWTEGKAACFGVHTGSGTPAFTVTMTNNHNVAGIFDGALTQKACMVTITGGGVIELSGVQGFDTENGSDGSTAHVTINNQISGSGQVVFEGNGQFFLYGTNTYSGGTMLGYSGNQWLGAIVNYNNNSSFGTGRITMTTNGVGSAFVAQGTSPITLPNAVTTATESLNIVPGSGGTTFTGPWSLGSTTPTIGAGSTAGWVLTLAGPISGSGGFIKANNGTMVFSGTNTYTGPTTISAGPLAIGGAGRLNNGAYGNTIANAGSFTYASSANQTLSGVISGAGSLTETGPGTLTLSGANTYTGGTTINGGILNVGSSGALASSGAITFGGGTLQYSSANATDYSSRFTAARPYKIDVNGRTVTFASALGVGSGASLTLSDSAGGGSLILNAANTYVGATTINSGTLALGGSASLNSSSPIVIGPGGTFDVSAITAYTLGGGSSLNAGGTSSPATINAGTTFDTGSRPITLAYDGSDPALTISQGTLLLNGNAFTVNGPVLGGGVYTLVQQASGSITSAGTYTVTGTAIPVTAVSETISVSGGSVFLTIDDTNTTITLNPLTPSNYGQTAMFTATVSPIPSGGAVQFYDNGMALGALVPVSGGTASYSLNTLAIGDHPITAAYGGTLGYAASATTNSSIQQVMLPPNSAPVNIQTAAFLGDGAIQLNFSGIPGYTYYIQASTNLDSPTNWIYLGTNVADINGLFNFIDTNAPSYGELYYRTTTQ